MKITCQSCQSKYTVSDEKVQGKTVKIKCRKCGATILVSSSGVSTSSGSSADAAPALGADASYLVNVAEGDQRSMSLPEIVTAYQSSVITGDTYVWADGMADWAALSQVEAIVNALNAPNAPNAGAAEPASLIEPERTPFAPEATVAMAPEKAPEAEPVPRAAAKRDNSRRGQDLFGERREEASASPGYTNGSASTSRSAPIGGREENSMLFSLSALTAKVASSSGPASQPAPRATSARDREDSGIIDLKALAAAAAATAPSSQSASADVLLAGPGLFPLGAPVVSAPVVAPPVVAPSIPPAKSKTPLFIGVGGAVAVAAIVGAFMIMKGGPPPAPATPAAPETATASAVPTTAPTTAPSASASVDAVDPGAATAAASASAKVAAKGGPGPRGPAGPGPGKAAGPATPPPPAATAAPAAPKKSACGCAAGDLMCAMKCSAK